MSSLVVLTRFEVVRLVPCSTSVGYNFCSENDSYKHISDVPLGVLLWDRITNTHCVNDCNVIYSLDNDSSSIKYYDTLIKDLLDEGVESLKTILEICSL
jgi:hypothetical protein